MERIGYYLYKKNYIERNDIDVIRYALEKIISEYIVTLCIYLILAVAGYVAEATLHIVLFTYLRKLLGGYHAKSMLGCSIISSILFVLASIIEFHRFKYEFMILTLLLLFINCLEKKVAFREISILFTLVFITASVIYCANVISITCVEVIILIKLERKEEKRHEQFIEDNKLSSNKVWEL